MTNIWIGNTKYCDVVYHEFENGVLFMQMGDSTFVLVSCENFIFEE